MNANATSSRGWLALALVALASCASPEVALPPPHDPSLAANPLTRADCARLAADAVPNAAAWQARIARADAALDRARALPNPTLLLEWEDLGLDHGSDSVPTQKTRSLFVSLSELLARPWRIDAAEFDRAAEAAAVEADRLTLATAVAHDYDALAVAREHAALLRELQSVAERSRDAVGRFVAVGELPQIAADRAAAEVDDAATEVASADIEARIRGIELSFALGFDAPVELKLAEPLVAAGKEVESLPELLDAAANARPEIAAAIARYRAAIEREQLADVRIEMLPTIGVGSRREGTTESETASIEVGLPIFDQGQNAMSAASAETLAAAAGLREATRMVSAEVTSARERAAATAVLLRDHAAPLAERRHAIADATEQLFRSGDAALDELFIVRRDEVKARLDLLAVQAALAAARVDLDAAVGRLAR